MREKMICVVCRNCGARIDERDIPNDGNLDIEEDEMGRDVLTFTCPKCGATSRSLRFG